VVGLPVCFELESEVLHLHLFFKFNVLLHSLVIEMEYQINTLGIKNNR
jgi:hypothetical protein